MVTLELGRFLDVVSLLFIRSYIAFSPSTYKLGLVQLLALFRILPVRGSTRIISCFHRVFIPRNIEGVKIDERKTEDAHGRDNDPMHDMVKQGTRRRTMINDLRSCFLTST